MMVSTFKSGKGNLSYRKLSIFLLCPILCPSKVGINGLIRHNGINGLYGKALKTVK